MQGKPTRNVVVVVRVYGPDPDVSLERLWDAEKDKGGEKKN